MSARPLPSWNDGAARTAILDFVAGSADVPALARRRARGGAS
jgi:hypothetical protein